jgi:hypothetical protein
MNPVNKMKALKGAVALAAILAMSGNAFGKKNGNGPGIPGSLSSNRLEVTVPMSDLPPCPVNTTATLSVYIIQSVGRLINIGTYSTAITCNGQATTFPDGITVEAFQGLSFQPGPATLLIRYTGTDAITLLPIHTDTGARVDLH